MSNKILNECIDKAVECIKTSQNLINLNMTKTIFEYNQRIQLMTEFYISVIENFEKLIKELEKNNATDNQNLISSTNDIIIKCENIINQFSMPTGQIGFMPPQKIQIIQGILNAATQLIGKCEKFIKISTDLNINYTS